MINRENLSELISFAPDQYFTTTLYLQIDGGSQRSETISLKDMIKVRKRELDQQKLSPEVLRSARSDLRKISDYVNLKFSREGVKTLVIFSCSGKKFWKTFTLNLPLRNELILNSRPHLRPLTLLLEDYDRFLVILVERAKARLFDVYCGEIIERSSILDEVPGKVRMGGFAGYEERRIERHVQDHVRRHFKHVADTAFELHKIHPFNSVVLLGSDQNTREFHHYLHNALHDRIIATEVEDIQASGHAILQRVLRIERNSKQLEARKLLDRLFTQVNSGGLGIVGLDSTIRALQQGQVNFLLIQEGYQKIGFRCIDCHSLLANNGACDYCGGKTSTVGDIVGEAVQEALHQGCQVKYIDLPDSPLRNAGQIGAMLRFRM